MSQITKLEARFRDARIRIDAITDIYHFLEALDPSYDLNQIDSSYKKDPSKINLVLTKNGIRNFEQVESDDLVWEPKPQVWEIT